MLFHHIFLFGWRREFAYEIVLRIKNLKRGVADGGLEEIINRGANRRVLGSWFLGRKRSTDEGIVIDAKRWRWMVEPKRVGHSGLGRLTQGSDVIENPEGTPVSGDDQVFAMNGEVADGSHGQIDLQGLPVVAIVE